jgi:serine/threonine protein kinase
LLTGVKPFDSDDDYELYERIISEKVDLTGEEMASVSEDAKDLILKVLTLNRHQRIPIEQVLWHRWITGSAPDVRLDNLNSH